MASMRTLRRRLRRWDRYAARYGLPRPGLVVLAWDVPLAGHWRAYQAVMIEKDRFWPATPDVWPPDDWRLP